MTGNVSAFGNLLRYWRGARKMSQLDVALEADVSSRHVSFIETGRSSPSRDMVLLLAEVLDVPLRERNALLQSAGFAPLYQESDLDSDALGPIRRSIEFMLEHHNPYPAVLVDQHWTLLMQNTASATWLPQFIANPAKITPPINSISILFDPNGLRPYVVNWAELASSMIQRLHREVAASPNDDIAKTLLENALAAEDVPDDWRIPNYGVEHPVIISLQVKRDDLELSLFSAITTLGTPLDLTLQGLRVETFFPADESTRRLLEQAA